MADSAGLDQFIGKVSRFGLELAESDNGAGAVALAMTTAVRRKQRTATGGDMKLSGVGKNGTRIGAKYVSIGDGKTVVQATGPAHLAEWDVKPHTITPKKGSGLGRRRSDRANEARQRAHLKSHFGITKDPAGAAVLALADGTFARYTTRAGGSKGRHPFENGVNQVLPATGEIMRRSLRASLAQTFR